MLKCVMVRKLAFLVVLLFVLSSLFLLSSSGEARPFFGRTIQLAPQTVAPGDGQILIDFILPQHHEFAYEAPSTIWTRFQNPNIFKTIPVREKPKALDLERLPHSLPYRAEPGQTVVVIELKIHFCDKETQICLTEKIRVKFLLRVEENAPQGFKFKIPLQSPAQQ